MDSQDRKKHIRRAVTVLQRALTAFAFVAAVIGVIGVFVYLLFRVAVFDSQVYAYLYLAAVVVLFVYMLVMLIKRKLIYGVLLRVSWVLIVIVSVCSVLAVIFLYGSLCIRYPIVGFVSAPIFILCLIYFLPRLSPLRRLKRYFS
jgi:hypothetical protein